MRWLKSREGFSGLFTFSLPERGELLQIALFLVVLFVALWRVQEDRRYLWFEEEGHLLIKAVSVPVALPERLRLKVKVLEGELHDLRGREAYLTLYGSLDIPSKTFLLYARVRAEGDYIHISGSYRDIEEVYFLQPAVRDRFIKKAEREIEDPQVRALVLTYLFGEARDTLPQDLQYYFLKTGLVHLLVISGFHVGMVFLTLKYLLPYPYGMLLGIAGVSLYVLFLVPAEPPVLRAWLMLLLWVLVRIYEGRPNSLGILLFSGSLLLLFEPEFSHSFSFWLSFFATLYIVLGLRLLPAEGSQTYRHLVLPFAVSFFAFMGVSPLLLSFTHTSLGSVLFSPVVGYLFLPFTAYGVLELLTFFSLPTFPLELIGKLILKVVSLLSAFDFQFGLELSVKSAFLLATAGASVLYMLSTKFQTSDTQAPFP
ncbi:MAG: ComEC/Rec2 family competence protein [Aquificaceae bacterium]|uniref:ComEC/Rec2 family competence protein n=1 Tax=Hydrogenobacter sp. Uz 6-8 TaxID=3384828 RepID=UPI0038FCB51A